MQSNLHFERLLDKAIAAVRTDGPATLEALDELPAPIYVTDSEGRVTHFNSACAAFAGRTPVVGEDRWCVTWKLYTEAGEFLPHDRCPMATAIRERRPVRGIEAVAERPDGTRLNFRPYPTPLFDDDGNFSGAVNMLVDITDRKQSDYLQAQAKRCRRLAKSIGDARTIETLTRMAGEFETKASELEQLH
ncbi:PAS domain-containing protein [Allosphingosinicella sp.]|jgi:PAS domain S-box-containing protein|uniref:PAS domain-containing protein n=1 Tax=Allosphingosinicella sp. TaxID=2823234 RepID=UPI002EFEE963